MQTVITDPICTSQQSGRTMDHNGNFNASAFLMPAMNETITDFSHRAVVAARVGKQITIPTTAVVLRGG